MTGRRDGDEEIADGVEREENGGVSLTTVRGRGGRFARRLTTLAIVSGEALGRWAWAKTLSQRDTGSRRSRVIHALTGL
jgi:hypothetical protein